MEGEDLTEQGIPRRYRAGDSLDDLCRVCKAVRGHTVIVAGPEGRVLRVICDYCGSQHNFRGGEDKEPPRPSVARTQQPERERLPLITEREKLNPEVKPTPEGRSEMDIELLLRRIIREETGLTPVGIAERWRDGEMVLRPGKPGLQEKSWPIETFFHKVVMLRNRLRVLEQQINGSELAEDQKVRLQGYITGCYGSLTSFNVLFADEEDRFQGSSGGDKDA
jgi:hypothetical protein